MKFCVTVLVLTFALQIDANPIEDIKHRLLDIGHKVLQRAEFVILQMQITRKPKADHELLRVKASELEVLLKHLEVTRVGTRISSTMALLLQAACELADRVDIYLAKNKVRMYFGSPFKFIVY